MHKKSVSNRPKCLSTVFMANISNLQFGDRPKDNMHPQLAINSKLSVSWDLLIILAIVSLHDAGKPGTG